MLTVSVRSNRWKIKTVCESSEWPLCMFPEEAVRYVPQLKLPASRRRVELCLHPPGGEMPCVLEKKRTWYRIRVLEKIWN